MSEKIEIKWQPFKVSHYVGWSYTNGKTEWVIQKNKRDINGTWYIYEIDKNGVKTLNISHKIGLLVEVGIFYGLPNNPDVMKQALEQYIQEQVENSRVYVRGGVAYTDSENIQIIDFDNNPQGEE